MNGVEVTVSDVTANSATIAVRGSSRTVAVGDAASFGEYRVTVDSISDHTVRFTLTGPPVRTGHTKRPGCTHSCY